MQIIFYKKSNLVIKNHKKAYKKALIYLTFLQFSQKKIILKKVVKNS